MFFRALNGEVCKHIGKRTGKTAKEIELLCDNHAFYFYCTFLIVENTARSETEELK